MNAFQIHLLCERALDGRRFIREVTEIVPKTREYRCLFRYENGEYHQVDAPTKELKEKMLQKLREEEKGKRQEFFTEVEKNR